MTRMLACVASADEAEIAIAGGADLLDLVDPRSGAHGKPDVEAVRALVAEIGSRVPVWTVAATGRASPVATRADVEALVDAGVDGIKVVLDAAAPWGETVDALAPVSGRARLIAVLFADRRIEAEMLSRASANGFSGAMLDVAAKGDGRLLDHRGPPELARFVDDCEALGLSSAFAGSLEAPDIPRLLALSPSVLGFRAALCRGHDRCDRLDANAVEAVRGLIPAERDPVTAANLARAVPRDDDRPFDRIYVRDLEVQAHVGAYRGERDKPQRLRFEVIADVRRTAAADDDLRNIVSYDLIIDAIERLVGMGHVDLLETLAERIADEMLRYDQVVRMTVKVEKPDMARGTVGIEIVRTRPGESAQVVPLRPAAGANGDN